MISYFNFKEFDNNSVLLTNDFGRFVFVSKAEFNAIVNHQQLDPNLEKELVNKMFIFNGSNKNFIDSNIYNMRESKSYIFYPTGLHIFVVTSLCNMNCIYCQANNSKRLYGVMNKETAKMAVDFALNSPQSRLTFEFQGGEPLLNFDIIKYIVEYTVEKRENKTIDFSLVTNLTLLTKEIIDFIKKYNISVSTSLDGNEQLHNINRPFIGGSATYEKVVNSINLLKENGISVGAIETTTRYSLNRWKEIVDTYCSLGFSNIFIRPLTPLGCARNNWAEIGYTEKEFLAFYKEALNYIIQINKNGFTMQENFATIAFSKILHSFPANYMELRSPCGAVFGQMAYYTNGYIFSCDEGRMLYEMGDDSFKIGNVASDSYGDVIRSKRCKIICESSVLETIPTCCDCVYQPYCGTCPVINMALYKDLLPKSPSNYRCNINKGLFEILFQLIHYSDEEVIRIINNWRL